MTDVHDLTAHLSEIATGYQRAQVLLTAVAADVFAHLETPRTADEVASALGWSPRGAAMLLDGLVALDLVQKPDGAYTNSPLASECLVPGRPHYQGNILRHHKGAWDTWGRLGEAVRTGSAVSAPQAGGGRSPEQLRNFILGMDDIARISARDVLGVVDIAPFRRMLDVGGGPGSYSITFVGANPNLHATVFDLPEVLPITREQVGKAGLEGRIGYVEGDLTRDALGQGYDLVLVSNIIHMLGPDAIRDLLRKCHEALVSGGLLIVKDFFPDDKRQGPPFALLFALHMLIHTGVGGTYTASELTTWGGEAGFPEGHMADLTPNSRLWLARKP